MINENWQQGFYLVGSEVIQYMHCDEDWLWHRVHLPISWPEGSWKPQQSCAVDFMTDHKGRVTRMRNAVSKEFLTYWPELEEKPEAQDAQADQVNPAHYKSGEMEVWQMMIKVYGVEAYLNFARLNAFKYRMRAGLKAGADVQTDINKALWYESKIKELTEKQNNNNQNSKQ